LAHAQKWHYKRGGDDWDWGCRRGGQSPVDITNPANEGGADSLELEFHYPAINAWQSKLKLVHTGNGIELHNPARKLGYLIFRKAKYVVREVRFHGPSEHYIRGERFAIEMQIIHQRHGATRDDDLLITSALFRASNKTNKFLNDTLFWEQLPSKKGERTIFDGYFQLGQSVVGLHSGYYFYTGTTTQPPCASGTQWAIFETIQDISYRQVADYNRLFKNNRAFGQGNGNARNLQPIAGRRAILHNHKAKGDGDGQDSLPVGPGPEDNVHHAGLEVDPERSVEFPDAMPNRASLPKLYMYGGDEWTGWCSKGRFQSPIDIRIGAGNPHGDYEMVTAYEAFAGAQVLNTGETFEYTGNFGRMYVSGVPYTAHQVTFHSPSEHRIDGRSAPLEMQIFHARTVLNPVTGAKEPEYTILSVLFYESAEEESEFLNDLSFNLLPGRGLTKVLPAPFNLYKLKGVEDTSGAGGYYSYAGSLSKPPCLENVKRFVLRTIQPIGTAQLGNFRYHYDGNARHVQPRNARGVVVHGVNLYPEVAPTVRDSLADGSLLPL